MNFFGLVGGKKYSAILVGLTLSSICWSLVTKALEKSPEEIAEEQCREMLSLSNSLGADTNTRVSVYIDGAPYNCN
jgi:hypothetical protein